MTRVRDACLRWCVAISINERRYCCPWWLGVHPFKWPNVIDGGGYLFAPCTILVLQLLICLQAISRGVPTTAWDCVPPHLVCNNLQSGYRVSQVTTVLYHHPGGGDPSCLSLDATAASYNVRIRVPSPANHGAGGAVPRLYYSYTPSALNRKIQHTMYFHIGNLQFSRM